MTCVNRIKLNCFNVIYSHQFFCVFAGCVSHFLNGYQWGYLSPALVKLGENGYYTIPPISSNTQSWMVTWLTIGFSPGAFCASYSNDLIGRKYSLILMFIPNLLAHLCTYFAVDISMFYLSQFLRGFHTGWIFVSVPNYISEIASPKLRGTFSAMTIVFNTIGARCVSSFVQAVTSIETTALIGIVISFIDLPFNLCVSESPYYYLINNNDTRSKDILKKLRNSQNVEQEFDEMKIVFKKNCEIKESSSWINLFSISVNLKVTLITSGVLTILQLSGHLPMSHFAHKIIIDSGLNIPLFSISLIMGTTHLISNLLSAFFIESWGRKPLFITLCSLSAMGHCIIALSMLLLDNTTTKQSNLSGIFELIGILFFETAVGFGFTHIAYTLGSELYPTNIKSKGVSFLKILMSGEGVLAVQIFELLTNIDSFIPFCCMALASLFGVIFGIIFVPETKSMSLAKIQEGLNK